MSYSCSLPRASDWLFSASVVAVYVDIAAFRRLPDDSTCCACVAIGTGIFVSKLAFVVDLMPSGTMGE